MVAKDASVYTAQLSCLLLCGRHYPRPREPLFPVRRSAVWQGAGAAPVARAGRRIFHGIPGRGGHRLAAGCGAERVCGDAVLGGGGLSAVAGLAQTAFVLPRTRSPWALLATAVFLEFTGPVCNLVWLFAGAWLQRFFVNYRRGVDLVMAASLALCAVSLVWPR